MTATDRDALIAEHLKRAERLAGAHVRRTGADFDEVRSDAFLGLVIGVEQWLESDRTVDPEMWVVTRIIWTMKDEWRIREGLQRTVRPPRPASLAALIDVGWEPPLDEVGYDTIEDRLYLEWLERAADADPDMQLAVAAVSTPLAQLGAAQDPPVTGSRISQRVRVGRQKLRELAAQSS